MQFLMATGHRHDMTLWMGSTQAWSRISSREQGSMHIRGAEEQHKGSNAEGATWEQEAEASVCCLRVSEDCEDAHAEFLGHDQHDRRTLTT